ncbi:hypothetical protein, partial [uncultured Nevskia sp.]|uniref:hypothetical protein n=1 Tax=uncultured Nevskia sp. TaxID=228950 RepID=UPI0025F62C0F
AACRGAHSFGYFPWAFKESDPRDSAEWFGEGHKNSALRQDQKPTNKGALRMTMSLKAGSRNKPCSLKATKATHRTEPRWL